MLDWAVYRFLTRTSNEGNHFCLSTIPGRSRVEADDEDVGRSLVLVGRKQ